MSLPPPGRKKRRSRRTGIGAQGTSADPGQEAGPYEKTRSWEFLGGLS